jgi:hypothetical protein
MTLSDFLFSDLISAEEGVDMAAAAGAIYCRKCVEGAKRKVWKWKSLRDYRESQCGQTRGSAVGRNLQTEKQETCYPEGKEKESIRKCEGEWREGEVGG